MSYHWLDPKGKVVKDGRRSAILGELHPGGSTSAWIVTDMPSDAGDYTLRLSPVQEGCAWFYLANPKAAKDIRFKFD